MPVSPMRGATAAIGAARSIRPSRWYVASLALVGEHSGARSLAWTRPIATANARASLLTTTEKNYLCVATLAATLCPENRLLFAAKRTMTHLAKNALAGFDRCRKDEMPRTPIRFEELPKGLMSYHGNFIVESTCRDQVDQLLKGANLAELPVLQPYGRSICDQAQDYEAARHLRFRNRCCCARTR